MGYYRYAGNNRTHDYTARYKKLDSFEFGKCVEIMREKNMKHWEHVMEWKDGNRIGFVLYRNEMDTGYKVGAEEIHETFYFDRVPNNYGGNKTYFLCPHCGRRVRYLYLHGNHFKCRTCANLNYLSQQLTKNEELSAHKIRKLLRDKFKVTEDLGPWYAAQYRPERPKGMHTKTYYRHLAQLFRLQNECLDQCTESMLKICRIFNK